MTTTSSEGPGDDDVTGSPTDQPLGSTSTRTDPPPTDQGPRVSGEQVRDLRRLRRTSGADRRVAGVAGGLARHLDVDPLLVRVGAVVLVFFGGSGLVAYLAVWLLVPSDDNDRAPVPLDARSRTIALVAAGVLAALTLLGSVLDVGATPWPAVVVGLLVLLVVAARRPREGTDPAPEQATFLPAPPRVDRGPLLLWPTLAAVVATLGVLALLDATALAVPGALYPALGLLLVGAALVLGAFRGRPGGLIALGLVLAVLTAATAAGGEVETGTVAVSPTTSAELASGYTTTVGELVVDLRDVADLEALDGRTLRLEAGAGRVEVLVPSGLAVDGEAQILRIGDGRAFGAPFAYSTVLDQEAAPGSADAPTLTLDVEVGLGEIVLIQDPRSPR